MNRWWIAGAAAFGLALATIPFLSGDIRGGGSTSAARSGDAAAVCRINPPKVAPLNYTLKDMNGKPVTLADYKGKVIMLNFWATWCGPCQAEIPMFVKLQDKYRDQGLVFLGVSIDDEPPQLLAYASRMKMNYPVLVGSDHEDLQEAYGPMVGIPTTMLIGRDGSICTKYMGAQTLERFERDIKALL
jgi:cytochrome c biogenesis protein CcmG, thiol:disulfide interchange protein DsbE